MGGSDIMVRYFILLALAYVGDGFNSRSLSVLRGRSFLRFHPEVSESGWRRNEAPVLQLFASTDGKQRCDEPGKKLLRLPLFPFKKAAKLPTEHIDLRLFEPRYLHLFDEVNSSDHKLFGALYVENKTSLSQGDVGIIAQMTDWTEPQEGVDLIGRRTVDVRSIAIGRFKVHHIVSVGIDDGASGPPYMLADVEVVDDAVSESEEEELQAAMLEKRVLDCIRDVERLVERLYNNVGKLWKEESLEEADEQYQAVYRYAPLQKGQRTRRAVLSSILEQAYISEPLLVEASGPMSSEARRRQLFSFAVVKTCELGVEDRQALLETTDTKKRLRKALAVLSEGRGWLVAK
ncbi:unnamed protein product [Choristocarpus tenellus]